MSENLDFISTYMPAYVELSTQELTDCRDRLERYSREVWPELDTSPNTVLGDLILTPQAFALASMEKGMERFMSDLDLANTAAGITYNCDFVEKYVKNFAPNSALAKKASGVVRLVFSENKDYTLDRSVRFAFDAAIFSIYLPNNGPFTIYKVGVAPLDGENGTTLIDTGSGVYYADVPLIGNTGSAIVLAGAAGLISVRVAELGAITALIDFESGTEEVTLQQLAQRSQQTIYSATLNTRHGTLRYINDVCPFVDGAYTIMSGDNEMVRGYKNNTLLVNTGVMDIYARSTSYTFNERQNLKLYYDEVKGEFSGEFHYTGQPYYVSGVYVESTTTAITDPVECTFTSVIPEALGLAGAYSKHERIFIRVPFNDMYVGGIEPDGRRYGHFVVDYLTDPMLPSIQATIENKDYRPENIDLLVRGFVPVIISQFEVTYVKKPGVVPLLTEASLEIKAYLAKLGAPDTYSDGVISRIMDEAGVKYTKHVQVKARVQWCVSSLLANSTTAIPAPYGHTVNITSSDALRVNYPPTKYTTNSAPACSVRNARYYLLEDALTFKEVKDI